jgi:hypothetical protein
VRQPSVMWGAAAVAAFLVPFAWFLLVVALIRALIRRTEWPAALRRGMVAFVLLGVPCLFVLILQVLPIR